MAAPGAVTRKIQKGRVAGRRRVPWCLIGAVAAGCMGGANALRPGGDPCPFRGVNHPFNVNNDHDTESLPHVIHKYHSAGGRLYASSVALLVDASWKINSHGPVLTSISLPNPTHLPTMRRPVGSTNICMAPWYRAPR